MHQPSLRLTATTARTTTLSFQSRFRSRVGIRGLHQRQSLPYPVEGGLGKFLPPEGLKVQLEYQDGLLERLNEQVVGTAEASTSITQTVINLSGKRDKILAFNYASLALNNSFFLNNLKPSSDKHQNYEHEISQGFASNIRSAHGSIEQLRSAFSAAALGMFTNGWVWFVSDQAGNTGTISTYGAGTLLIRSRSNMERYPSTTEHTTDTQIPSHSPVAPHTPPGTSPTSPLSGMSGDISSSSLNSIHPRFYHNNVSAIMSPTVGLYSPHTASNKRAPSSMLHAGEILYPLFCIPIYEHAWMSSGYGVWGKEQWLKEFWSVLNWQKVDATYSVICDARGKKTRL